MITSASEGRNPPRHHSSPPHTDLPVCFAGSLLGPGQPSPGRISPHASCHRNSLGFRNMNRIPIGYGSRPPLALGADLPWEDDLYPGNLRFSAEGNPTLLFVYSYLHSLFHPLQEPSQIPLHRSMECSPTTRTLRRGSAASACRLAPLHYLRTDTRPVSYYALFEGMAASKPTSWLSSRPHLISHLAAFRGLSRRSGLFPSRPRTLSHAVSLLHVGCRHSQFDWVW